MTKFLNFTEIPEKEALALIEDLRDLIKRGESERIKDLERANRNRNIFKNEIWDDEDLKFFESMNMSPYKFAVQRPLINNLISRQRNRRFTYEIVPTDIHSFKRQRDGRDKFIAEHMDEFDSIEQAELYYDNYADDEFAKVLSAVLNNTRVESKAKYVESEVFQYGLVTGVDFFKAVFSTKYNKEGGIEISRRPQNAVLYDKATVDYDLKDIEYIGEVHLLYKEQLVQLFPERKAEIEEYFKGFTTMKRDSLREKYRDWSSFYTFERESDENKLRVAEIWHLKNEDRFVVVDKENNEQRVVKFGMTEEEIMEGLRMQLMVELMEQAEEDEQVAELIMSDGVEKAVEDMIAIRFEIGTTVEPVWFKTVFSWNALLEHTRSPFPHQSHPYTAFFANFNEGEYFGLIDDIADVIYAINKALAFRELMMAHGAKGLVVVDHDTMIKSGYAPEDIADEWSALGGMLILKLKAGKKIQDVFETVTTIGQGLGEINNILQDLDNRLYLISGVNLAQLGIMERQTTTSGYRQQIAEGEATNGLLFDNFVRALENFYNDKVVPLVAEHVRVKKTSVIRMLGDDAAPWLEVDFNETYDLFDQAIRTGQYATVIVPKEENPRINAERSAKYMEMALAGLLDPEVALEFSDDPNRHKIIKRNREKLRQRVREQAAHQVDMQMVQQLMMEEGYSAEQASNFLDTMRKAKMKEEYAAAQEKNGERRQMAQGASTIKNGANESQRTASVEQNGQTIET